MNSRVSWSVEGIEPSVRERAEAAARRAGMSLGDWLNSAIGEPPAPAHAPQQPYRSRNDFAQPNPAARPSPMPAMPPRDAKEVAEIHQRLDAITRQIDQISRPAARSSEPAVARQLNEAISRLDARLSQISEPAQRRAPAQDFAPAPQLQPQSHYQPQPDPDMVERAASQVYSASPPIDPFSLDFAIAEIAARQDELDGTPRLSPRQAPPIAPTQPAPAPAPVQPANFAPDMSGLERQLSQITSQIEKLHRPEAIEQSITLFRNELAEIRGVITEAMPRRAIESLEGEIRSLALRIDDSRQSGIDDQALAGVERALADIHGTLRTLTPAEQLAGFDDAIRNLGGKIDMIVRTSGDPRTLEQLESAIAALREIVANVASNEALGRLGNDVRTLASKVDQLAEAEDYSGSFAALEARIATLTSTLENRERPAAVLESDHLESALRALSDRLDNMQVGNDSSSAIAHLEQRVSHLLERLETSVDTRSGNFSRVEDGLQDILRHLERQQSVFAAALNEPRPAPATAPLMDPTLVDTIKRELSDMRFSQSETDRHTQDSLEVVHNTLGHVVDRLAIIEGDLRNVRAAPVAPPPAAPSAPSARMPAPASAPRNPPVGSPMGSPLGAPPIAPPGRPNMPNPVQGHGAAAAQARPPVQTQVAPPVPVAPPVHFDAAPREFAATAISHEPAASFSVPKAISDILDPPKSAPPQARAAAPIAAPPVPSPAAERAPQRAAMDPGLPPDFPLEPGTRPQGRTASPSERIAASEEAISELTPAAKEQASASSFIAAARRAAQAAAASGKDDKAKPAGKTAPKVAVAAGDKPASSITSKIRSLLVGASVVVIVLGSFKVAMSLLDTSGSVPVAESVPLTPSQPMEIAPPPSRQDAAPAAPAAPSMTSPTPIGRQSMVAPAPQPQSAPVPQAAPIPFIAETGSPVTTAAPAPASNDITGSIPTPQASASPVLPPSNRKLSLVPVPASERLPEAIGGTILRNAALKGDATAAYEIAVRFAEGKGVASNYDEAAKWFDRAAQAGVVPGMFRLGTLYEKGLGVKKDLDVARRYYMQAADRGNAKAMHNLAVLDADGGTKGANYKSASLWFRKAADRGVADSQFNLGILYARGIGVEQNLAESFKWFSLAAAQGDVDSGQKRDDVAKRLDPQSLAAAKLALKNFVPEGQPEDAITVATPVGGWDSATAAAKPALGKRASAK